MGLAVTKQESFWEACGYGRIYEVKSMLAAGGINVNWKSYTHDCCPIHVASQGKIEIVKMLLEANCDVNARDDRDNLAIHHAAMKGHTDIIQLLLNAGSKKDCIDKNGWTPLINAAYWCQPEVCDLLIKNGVNVHLKNKDKRTAVHEACRSESKDEEGLATIVQLLAECGCDIDSKSSDDGEADFTPLMFCAYHGHPKVAKILIDADCRINETGKNSWSALHWAADRGNIAVVEVLLHGGIDVFIKGMRDELAIDRATDNKIIEMISEAMQLNDTEHKIAMETRGSLAKKLYVPRGGARDNYENGLATSPRMENLNVATSEVFQSMQAQMVTLSDQVKSRKTRRVERRISQRIFEPPRPPAEEKDNSAPQLESPVSDLIDAIDFMDDDEEGEAGSNVNHQEAGSNNLNGDQSQNGISGSQSNGSIPSRESNLSSLSTNSENVNGTILENGIPVNSDGVDKSASLKDISNVNGLCNNTQKVVSSRSQQEVELFDENEIDGEGFEDNMLH